VLVGRLREAIRRLNPAIPEDADRKQSEWEIDRCGNVEHLKTALV
jgi:hypothetical protein